MHQTVKRPLIYAEIIEFILEAITLLTTLLMLLIAFLASVEASQFTSRYLDPLLNIPGTDCSHKIGGLLLQESLMI